MRVSALASGSSGNCFYVEDDERGILVDCGISCKRVLERLNSIGRSPENLKGIFVTHEHADHIKGVDVLARNFQIPIFATKDTAKNSFLCSDDKLVNFIKKDEIFSFGALKIEAFAKSHKAADPVSFNIFSKKKVSIMTDVGYCDRGVEENVADSDFLCLESNHDVDMLENGHYPYFLKKWIKSDIGHLSNNQASLCVLEHAHRKLKNVILSHLSESNNTPELALKTFSKTIKERKDLSPRVFVSTKIMASELIRV